MSKNIVARTAYIEKLVYDEAKSITSRPRLYKSSINPLSKKIYFFRFFLDVTLSILGSFKLDVTLLFWVITSLYSSPITCSHGTLLFFILSISLLSKNYLRVRDLKSVTFNKKTEEIYNYVDCRFSNIKLSIFHLNL